MQKNWSLVALSLLMSLVLTSACAQTEQEAALIKLVEPQLGDGVKVDSIKKSPYLGLYEVIAEGNIFYTDEKAQYLFVGNVMELKTHKNLTKAKIDALSVMKVANMPLELAIKQVKGNGKRVLAVFEDPNCGYCKRLRKELMKIDNITIYTFMYDILSDDSEVKSRNVWCSSDPGKAWNDWMLNGKVPAEASPKCMSNPHERILALGSRLHLSGTPAIFFEDGTRIPGFVEAAAIEDKLSKPK